MAGGQLNTTDSVALSLGPTWRSSDRPILAVARMMLAALQGLAPGNKGVLILLICWIPSSEAEEWEHSPTSPNPTGDREESWSQLLETGKPLQGHLHLWNMVGWDGRLRFLGQDGWVSGGACSQDRQA